MPKTLKRIAVTGGAGQIAYNLLFRIGSGEMLGADQPVALHILEVPEAMKMLEGVKMELEDCAFPLLREIKIGSDPYEVFKGIHYALLVGAKPPVGFFAYPGKPSKQYPPQAQLHVLARVEQDGEAALRALADELGAPEVALPDVGPRPHAMTGAPTPEGLAQTLAAVMPEQA